MKRWQHCLCLFALVCVLQTALVVAEPPQGEQDALTTIASSFPILVSAHSWNTTNASEACSGSWGGITCDGDNIESIILDGIALNNNMPSNLASFTALKTISLSGCGLTGSIASFPTTIVAISLANNELSGSIPSLATLTALTTFDVSSNDLVLCVNNPALPSSVATCSVSGQSSGSSCACTASYTGCTQDSCVPTPVPAAPSPPPTAPTSTPIAPIAPTSPPTAPVAPTTPPTAPQAVPAPVVTPVEPVSPPTAAPVTSPAPETSPQAPQTAPSVPSVSPQATPSAPAVEPSAEPQTVPEVAPTAVVPVEDAPMSAPIDFVDIPLGSIVPMGICADGNVLTLAPPYPIQFIFSYKSNLTGPVTIPVGPSNLIYADVSGGATAIGQPTTFYPGTHNMVVRVNGFATAPVRWTLANYTATITLPTDQSTICPRTPVWTLLEFAGASTTGPVLSANLESYICDLLSVNCSVPGRVTVDVDDGGFRRATLTANVTLGTDMSTFAITGYGMMQRLLANISSTPNAQALFTNAVAPGSSLAAVTPAASVPTIEAVYTATPGADNAPYFGPRTPYTYYRLTGAQIAGVVIAVVCGVALLIAVAIGLWFASKPARTTSSAHSGGIASSARSDSTNGNTTRDADPADEGSTDDEEDDDEDDDSASPSSVEDSEVNEESEEEEEEDEESQENESSEVSSESESSEEESSEESS